MACDLLSSLRRSGGFLLGAVLQEMYPDLEVGLCEEKFFGFSLSFLFPHPIHPEFLDVLSERMRQEVREEREIVSFEMVVASAVPFLEKHAMEWQAHILKETCDPGMLVWISQMGSFISLSGGDLCSSSAELGAFQLLDLFKGEEGEVRIRSALFRSKKELKEFLRRWRAYPSQAHLKVGEEMGFWKTCLFEKIWCARGVSAKEHLKKKLEKILFQKAFLIEKPPNMSIEMIENEWGENELAWVEEEFPFLKEEEGFFEGGKQTRLMRRTRDPLFLLQQIGKSLRMLGFSFQVNATSLRGKETSHFSLEEGALEGKKRVSLWVDDALGRSWEVFSLEKKQESWMGSLSVERNFSLLVELLGRKFEFENE